jgi:ATP-binding cassette subfamily C (CFTR/MRP) protein 4
MVIIGALVVPLSVIPWMIIPLILVAVVFFFLQKYFISTARELRRLDNIGRSPLFVHTNSALEGITTIRSSEKQKVIKREFDEYSDCHTRAFYGFLVVHRWFGLRLDMLCSLYTILTLFVCIFLRGYIKSFIF